LFGLAAVGSLTALLPSCGATERGSPVPRTATVQASVLGLPNERFFPLAGTDPLEAEFAAAAQRLRRARGLSPTAPLPQVQLLAVSGGGWSEQGTRPSFELVTGVSTGALTAPFAYLGSAYDAQLRAVYTQLSQDDVLTKRMFTALRDEIDPTIAAISTLMTAVSFMLVLVATSRSKKGG